MEVEAKCDFCKKKLEDLKHALIYCPSIRDFWNRNIPALLNMEEDMNKINIALFILSKGDINDLTTFFLIAWAF